MTRKPIQGARALLGAVLVFYRCRGRLRRRLGTDGWPPGITERFALHGQFTYVAQETAGFSAPYSGTNSLLPDKGAETTDATLYLGARLWSGAEAWFNPELDQGFGLDNTVGVAGFPSGEAYKVGKKKPYVRFPRIFIRDTVSLDGPVEKVDSDLNVLGGAQAANRWVFSIGKFGVGDVFDVNQYAHDPRGGLSELGAVDAGTFDYAADAWGYTVGAAAERYQGSWTVRAGLFDLSQRAQQRAPGAGLPRVPEHRGNRKALCHSAAQRQSHAHRLRQSRPHGPAGPGARAAQLSGTAVDITRVRSYRSRLGADVNLEQQLTDDLGAFARVGKAAGNVEAYEFSDIDRATSLGLSLKGTSWHRTATPWGWPACSMESQRRASST